MAWAPLHGSPTSPASSVPPQVLLPAQPQSVTSISASPPGSPTMPLSIKLLSPLNKDTSIYRTVPPCLRNRNTLNDTQQRLFSLCAWSLLARLPTTLGVFASCVGCLDSCRHLPAPVATSHTGDGAGDHGAYREEPRPPLASSCSSYVEGSDSPEKTTPLPGP